jgi:hypothetical protein
MALNVCFCVVERLEMGVVSNADWAALVKSLTEPSQLGRCEAWRPFVFNKPVPKVCTTF